MSIQKGKKKKKKKKLFYFILKIISLEFYFNFFSNMAFLIFKMVSDII